MIVIEKARRRLRYTRKGREVFSCAVSLGAHPEGAKREEGDGRTPEGEYRVCVKNSASKFHAALGLNYPNAKDARRALKAGRAGLWDAARVIAANALCMRPPWRTPMGGFVMLHGESPEGKTGDWTAGCIAMDNRDIDFLMRACKKGERVRILP